MKGFSETCLISLANLTPIVVPRVPGRFVRMRLKTIVSQRFTLRDNFIKVTRKNKPQIQWNADDADDYDKHGVSIKNLC